jgi:hypothetical protein
VQFNSHGVITAILLLKVRINLSNISFGGCINVKYFAHERTSLFTSPIHNDDNFFSCTFQRIINNDGIFFSILNGAISCCVYP